MIFFSKSTWMYILIIIGAGWFLSLLSPILAPFLIAAFLAYICDPFVDWLQTKKLSRTGGVCVVFTLMFVVLSVLVAVLAPLAEAQVRVFLGKIPLLIDRVNTDVIPFLESYLSVDISEFNTETISNAAKEHWNEVGGFLGVIAHWIGDSTQFAIAILSSATIVPVVTFYLLRDWDLLISRIHELIPRQFESRISRFSGDADSVLAEFFRGQLALMLAQAVFFSVALSIIGLDVAFLVGFLAGAVSFVPYLGVVIGLSVGVLAAYLQFQEWLPILLVCGVFGLGQILEGVVLQPLLIGDRIGLHPVTVIFAVMAGGQLFGFVGVLIALPVAAVVTVLLRHLHELYVASELYDAN